MISDDRQQSIIDASGEAMYELLNIPGVHCLYPATKIVDGVDTHVECMVIGVEKKIASEEIIPEHIIPKKLNNTVITDVLQIPPVVAQGFCGGQTPFPQGCPEHIYDPDTNEPYIAVPGGISMGNANLNDAGTLGMLVRDRSTRELVGMTSNHTVGPQTYIPSTVGVTKEYDVFDDGRTFKITAVNQPGLSAIEPNFTDYQSYPAHDIFPGIIAGSLYKFNCRTNLHDFYISTQVTSQSQGGGSLNPYTNVSIVGVDGNVRYNSQIGTGSPAASAGESLYLLVDPSTQLSTSLYYGSWTYPNIGGQIVVMYCGIPPQYTKNRNNPGTPEYDDGVLQDRYINITGSGIGHPSNIDNNKYGGTGQTFIGTARSTVPIKFCHPYNTVQPLNRVDAATIRFDASKIEASQDIIGLADGAIEAKTAKIGDHVFKSGRTTGVTPSGAGFTSTGAPSGYINPCVITSTNATFTINYAPNYPNTVQSTAIFQGCIFYSLTGEYFSSPGDSGAALLLRDTDDNNKLKLTGIHVAGGVDSSSAGTLVTYGVGSPVARVFDDLNIDVWEGTIIANSNANCIMVDGLCYQRVDETFVAATHLRLEEEFDDCADCINQ